MANSSFACSSWRRKLGLRRAQALAQCVERRSVLCRLHRLASGLPNTHCLLDQPAAFRAGRDPPCLSDQFAPLLASRSADGVPNQLPSRRTGCKPDCPAKRRRHEQTLASERPPTRVARQRHAPRLSIETGRQALAGVPVGCPAQPACSPLGRTRPGALLPIPRIGAARSMRCARRSRTSSKRRRRRRLCAPRSGRSRGRTRGRASRS